MKRGVPAEVLSNRRRTDCGRKKVDAWRRAHDVSPTTFGVQQQGFRDSRSVRRHLGHPSADGLLTTYSQHGRIPGFANEVCGKPAKHHHHSMPCFPDVKADMSRSDPGPGDHTRGIRSKTPHFAATYWQLGQVPGFEVSEYGRPAKHNHHSVPIFTEKEMFRPGSLDASDQGKAFGVEGAELARSSSMPDMINDYSKGIRGRKPHFSSTYHQHGAHQDWKEVERGNPAKHHHHSVSCYPEINRPYVDAMQASSPKLMEGDYTRGIRSDPPKLTSWDLGGHASEGLPFGKRYDMTDVAMRDYRFTVWNN